jgi:hypothetical protein
MPPANGRRDVQMPGRPAACSVADIDSDSDWSDDDGDAASSDRDLWQQFPEVLRDIDRVIAKLGGKVVPKLNWSCPTDATWLTTSNNLACQSADEVRDSCLKQLEYPTSTSSEIHSSQDHAMPVCPASLR